MMGESKCIVEYATGLWHQLSRWLPTPVEWETDSSWSMSSEGMAPPPSGTSHSAYERVDEELKAGEFVVDPKIVTRDVDEIEQGMMAPGVEAGC